ncbi:MAG: NrfD/PsrC family molybdoenzyme membrane anchor subunit, partial [Blastocatellia bacterium]
VGLLVWDLKRPDRFLSILFRPQWKSWLVLGGYILVIFGALLMAWMLIPLVGLFQAEGPVMFFGALFAMMSAVYSAFLFRQARGRVFWHSTLTPLHLLVQAIVAGAAVLMLVVVADSIIFGSTLTGPGWSFLYYEFIGALVADAVLIAGELFMPEENVERRRAVRLITRGIFRKMFWGGAVILGVILPLLTLLSGAAEYQTLAILASLFALAGLFLWEYIWVQAGQAVPLS